MRGSSVKDSDTLCYQTDEEQVAAGVDVQRFFEGAPALLEVSMKPATSQVLSEVAAERAYQETRWGTTNDDANTPHQWMGYISAYGSRDLAVGANVPVDAVKFRTDMIKVAAIAVAAVEALDRKPGAFVALKAVA